MVTAEVFDHLRDVFFLFQGRFVAGRLLGMDAGHHLQEFLPGFGAVDHESREMLGVMPLSGAPRPQGPYPDTNA